MKRPHTPAPTKESHFKPVPHSGTGHAGLGNASTEMGVPYPKSSDRSEVKSGMGMPAKTKKSNPDVPSDIKKWHRKGYSMESPS